MAKHTAVDTPEGSTMTAEQAREQIAALLAQFGSNVIPVAVAAERVEAAKIENKAEIDALRQANLDLRAQIDPINEQIKANLVKLMELTGSKSVSSVSGTRAPRTEQTCPECGQGRHSQWTNKAKGIVNEKTANCKTFAAKQAARAAANTPPPVQTELAQ